MHPEYIWWRQWLFRMSAPQRRVELWAKGCLTQRDRETEREKKWSGGVEKTSGSVEKVKDSRWPEISIWEKENLKKMHKDCKEEEPVSLTEPSVNMVTSLRLPIDGKTWANSTHMSGLKVKTFSVQLNGLIHLPSAGHLVTHTTWSGQ